MTKEETIAGLRQRLEENWHICNRNEMMVRATYDKIADLTDQIEALEND